MNSLSCLYLLLVLIQLSQYVDGLSVTFGPVPAAPQDCENNTESDKSLDKPQTESEQGGKMVQFSNNTFQLNFACDEPGYPYTLDRWYVIRHTETGLVMDGTTRKKLTGNYYTGHANQLWKFEPVLHSERPGVYHILHNATGAVLDVDAQGNLILASITNSRSQNWIFNSNGRLYNVGSKRNIELKYEKTPPVGSPFVLQPDNKEMNQEFELQEIE